MPKRYDVHDSYGRKIGTATERGDSDFFEGIVALVLFGVFLGAWWVVRRLPIVVGLGFVAWGRAIQTAPYDGGIDSAQFAPLLYAIAVGCAVWQVVRSKQADGPLWALIQWGGHITRAHPAVMAPIWTGLVVGVAVLAWRAAQPTAAESAATATAAAQRAMAKTEEAFRSATQAAANATMQAEVLRDRTGETYTIAVVGIRPYNAEPYEAWDLARMEGDQCVSAIRSEDESVIVDPAYHHEGRYYVFNLRVTGPVVERGVPGCHGLYYPVWNEAHGAAEWLYGWNIEAYEVE